MAFDNHDDDDGVEDRVKKRIPWIDNSNNNNKVPALFLIHLFQALACNYTPGITLVLSKLVSLASGHGFRPAVSNKQHNNHVRRQPCQTPVMSATATINEYVAIYLSCLYFYYIYYFIYSYSLTLFLFVHFSQRSIIINNHIDAFAIKSIANMTMASLL